MTRFIASALLLPLLLIGLTGCPPGNSLPVPDAGPDQSVSLGDTVTLNGTASTDADGDTLTYQWIFTSRPEGSTASLSNVGTPQPTFQPDVPGTYVLSLTVFDSMGSGTPDSVTISVTGTLVTVPDVSGLTQATAETALNADGLSLGTVTTESSATVPGGQVIRQNPAAGSDIIPNGSVDLVISTGPATVTVPNVVGQSRTEAESTLNNLGLVIGTITMTESDTVATGDVISQSIDAETMVNEGTAIDLTISSGAPVAIARVNEVNLRAGSGLSNLPNQVRRQRVAADTTNQRFFLTGLFTPFVSIRDAYYLENPAYLDTGFVLPGEKIPFVAPGGTVLYVVDLNTRQVARIDVESNTVTAMASVGAGFLDLVVSTANNTLYLTRETSPSLVFLDATTLAETGSTTEFNGTSPHIELNTDTGQLLVLDTASENADGSLGIVDTATNTRTGTVTFDMPGSGPGRAHQLVIDIPNSRFFIRGSNGLGVYALDGSNPRSLPLPSTVELTDFHYDPAGDRLLTMGLSLPDNGEVAPQGARLFAYNPNTGQTTSPIDTINLGDGNTDFAVDPVADIIFSPDSTDGRDFGFEAAPFPTTTTRGSAGTSVEDAIILDGALVGASIFGGNYLFRLGAGADATSSFVSGRWPSPLRASGTTLYVLNAWDSTLESFASGETPTSTGSFATGFPRGTTERRPDFAIDPSNSRAAVVYPEFGQVRVIALGTGSAIAVLDVPDATPGIAMARAGELQVQYSTFDDGVLYLFDRLNSVLHRYDTNDDYSLIGSSDLSASLSGQDDAPEEDWLVQDAASGRLFVGPVAVDPATGMTTGESLATGQIIRGIDIDQDLYWTARQVDSTEGYTVTINSIHRSDLSVAPSTLTLGTPYPRAPEIAFDTANRRFFVVDPSTAIIEEYEY